MISGVPWLCEQRLASRPLILFGVGRETLTAELNSCNCVNRVVLFWKLKLDHWIGCWTGILAADLRPLDWLFRTGIAPWQLIDAALEFGSEVDVLWELFAGLNLVLFEISTWACCASRFCKTCPIVKLGYVSHRRTPKEWWVLVKFPYVLPWWREVVCGLETLRADHWSNDYVAAYRTFRFFFSKSTLVFPIACRPRGVIVTRLFMTWSFKTFRPCSAKERKSLNVYLFKVNIAFLSSCKKASKRRKRWRVSWTLLRILLHRNSFWKLDVHSDSDFSLCGDFGLDFVIQAFFKIAVSWAEIKKTKEAGCVVLAWLLPSRLCNFLHLVSEQNKIYEAL